jgi:hypothetical protein
MAADFFTLCLFLATCLRLTGTLNAVPDEIEVYQTSLAFVIATFKRVEAIRNSTWCSNDKGIELDIQLRKIKDALNRAERAVSWIARDVDGSLLLGPRERLAWSLIYKKIARAYENLLILCKEELVEIRAEVLELDRASKEQYPELAFFEKIRQQTLSRLFDRTMRNSKRYAGPGDQLSRSVANAIVSFTTLRSL